MGMFSYVTNEYSKQPCDNCGVIELEGQWWSLNGYFKVSGYFCPHCYELVSHDSYKQPNHPSEYTTIAVRQQLERANNIR